MIPRFDGLSPYVDYPFQYSLHILDKPGGRLRHTEYLHQDNSNPMPALIEKMKKDFDNWNSIKKDLTEKKSPFFSEGEIWISHVGINIGDEEDGKGADFLRPFLIIKKWNNSIFWAIPLSTKIHKTGVFYYPFQFSKRKSIAMLSQIKLSDAKRLKRKIGNISSEDFRNISVRMQSFFNTGN